MQLVETRSLKLVVLPIYGKIKSIFIVKKIVNYNGATAAEDIKKIPGNNQLSYKNFFIKLFLLKLFTYVNHRFITSILDLVVMSTKLGNFLVVGHGVTNDHITFRNNRLLMLC